MFRFNVERSSDTQSTVVSPCHTSSKDKEVFLSLRQWITHYEPPHPKYEKAVSGLPSVCMSVLMNMPLGYIWTVGWILLTFIYRKSGSENRSLQVNPINDWQFSRKDSTMFSFSFYNLWRSFTKNKSWCLQESNGTRTMIARTLRLFCRDLCLRVGRISFLFGIQ
jgi:hypothetical protein